MTIYYTLQRKTCIYTMVWKNSSFISMLLKVVQIKVLVATKGLSLMFVKTAAWRVKWNFKIRKTNVKKTSKKYLLHLWALSSPPFPGFMGHLLLALATRCSGYESLVTLLKASDGISSTSHKIENTLGPLSICTALQVCIPRDAVLNRKSSGCLL